MDPAAAFLPVGHVVVAAQATAAVTASAATTAESVAAPLASDAASTVSVAFRSRANRPDSGGYWRREDVTKVIDGNTSVVNGIIYDGSPNDPIDNGEAAAAPPVSV